MRLLYRILVNLLALPFCLVLALRGLRDRGYWTDFSQRFGFGARQSAGSIWVHAVSVGEVQAAASLVRLLRERHGAHALTLTTTTATGAARARALFGATSGMTVDVRFLPLDTRGSVRRFLDRVQPAVAIIIEKEIWPQLYHECTRRGIPVVLASAAVAPRSLARYRRLLNIFDDTLTHGLIVAAQSAADAERFASIGVPVTRLHMVGNLKFDLRLPEGLEATGRALRECYGWTERCVLVAGSTYEPEEEALLEAQRQLRMEGHALALVLAPRHPPRFPAVAARLQRSALAYRQHSRSVADTGEAGAFSASARMAGPVDVLLLDTLGDLLQCYAAADIAYVGGSLVAGIGGHNLIEPAALAVPTLTGPHGDNSADVCAALVAQRALVVVNDPQALTAALRAWLVDPAARRQYGERAQQFVTDNRGTLQRLMAIIDPLIAAAKSPSTRC